MAGEEVVVPIPEAPPPLQEFVTGELVPNSIPAMLYNT
jgi:hypothetical protein